MQSIHDLITEHPFFVDLPHDDVEMIAGCGQNVHFHAGESIFREGGAADTFYVIRHGRVALEVHAPDRGGIVVGTLGEGEVLGWSWLFPPYRWEFDARALDETSAVALDGACIRGKCDEDTALGYRLMQRFARIAQEHLQAARMQLLDLYGGDPTDAAHDD